MCENQKTGNRAPGEFILNLVAGQDLFWKSLSYESICLQTCLLKLMSQICSGNMFAWSLDGKIPPFLVFSNWERNALVYRRESSLQRKNLFLKKICSRARPCCVSQLWSAWVQRWLGSNFWYFSGITFKQPSRAPYPSQNCENLMRKDFPQSTQRRVKIFLSFRNWKSTVQDRNWSADVLGREGKGIAEYFLQKSFHLGKPAATTWDDLEFWFRFRNHTF